MNIKRVIVSRTDKIGDLILSIPSFFMIKKMYPQEELVVLVRKYNYEIVKNLPYVDRIIKIDDYTHSELIEKIVYFKAGWYRKIKTSGLKVIWSQLSGGFSSYFR